MRFDTLLFDKMRYNKNYKFTRIIIERVVIMVMDNNLKSALKSRKFF